MSGRFGKYGDAKRKARIRKTRLSPPVSRQRSKGRSIRESRRTKKRTGILSGQQGDSVTN